MAEGVIASIPKDVIEATSSWMVKDMSILKGVSLKATSKIHRFKPTVSLLEAVQWTCDQNEGIQNLDFTFIFENGSAVLFGHGKFVEFENMEDDE